MQFLTFSSSWSTVLWSCYPRGFATHASTGWFFTVSSLIFKPLTADSVFADRLHMLRYCSCNYIYGLWTQLMRSKCVTIPRIQTLTAHPVCACVCVQAVWPGDCPVTGLVSRLWCHLASWLQTLTSWRSKMIRSKATHPSAWTCQLKSLTTSSWQTPVELQHCVMSHRSHRWYRLRLEW